MLELDLSWRYVFMGCLAMFVLGLIMMRSERERDEKLRAVRAELARTTGDLDNTRQELDDTRRELDELRSASMDRDVVPKRRRRRPRTRPLPAAKRKV